MNLFTIIFAMLATVAFVLKKKGNGQAAMATPFLMLAVIISSLINVIGSSGDSRQLSGIEQDDFSLQGEQLALQLKNHLPENQLKNIALLTFKQDEQNQQKYTALIQGMQKALPDCSIRLIDSGICRAKPHLNASELDDLLSEEWSLLFCIDGMICELDELNEENLFQADIRGQRKIIMQGASTPLMEEMLEVGKIDMYFKREAGHYKATCR